MLGGNYRFLSAAEAAAQPVPQHLTLNYADLFKIQRVRNPFPLRPVSVSRVLAYLECPSCALDHLREKRSAEPRQFRKVHQSGLFHTRESDPHLIGVLLHEAADLLHARNGLIEADRQATLLTSPEALARFLRSDFFNALQTSGKFQLAMVFNEISRREETFQSTLLVPMLSYQRELQLTESTVFAPAERFQFKLLSTSNTFSDHQDWGGYVGLVGEFDQIRLRKSVDGSERPAIVEFQKDSGKKRQWDRSVKEENRKDGGVGESLWESDESREPGLAHALQLMMDWLAFQTRWDVLGQAQNNKGRIVDLPITLEQNLDLILYNLHDGRQYQLMPTQMREALLSVVSCLFFVNWAMKSGYSWQSPEHDCRKTALLREVPNPLIQVGSGLLSAEKCYQLASDAFRRFSRTVSWHLLPAE